MDGWNRIDVFNILANPFTTTRPAVTLGDRRQFTQLEETFTDKFALGDVAVNYNFGSVGLSSITSYNDRDVLVIRDATALTASITGGSIGLPPRPTPERAALRRHQGEGVDGGAAPLRRTGPRAVGGGRLLQPHETGLRPEPARARVRGPDRHPHAGTRAPKDSLFFSDLHYKLDQFALFGEGTLSLSSG